MPVLSSKSRDFLGSSGPEKGASPPLSEIAFDVAQFLVAPHGSALGHEIWEAAYRLRPSY